MSDKPDTVPGLGFKHPEKALESLKILEGRDPDYQKLAVKGLIGRAKRVLTLTKDKEKHQNITDAIKTFDIFLKDFEKENRSKENRSYLPLDSIQALLPLRKQHKIEDKQSEEFLKAYKSVKGEYKNLRTVSSGENEPTWDIVRNVALKKLMKNIEENDPEMWKNELPTKEHMELILWAYSPDASKIKKNKEKFEDLLKNEQEDEVKDDENYNDEEDEDERGIKRKSETSSESSDEESPKKKTKT
ncbi:uncharacterized protein [Onthophagus taurus]|uniref:uncharacterized protein n=1 Tax=Onthophagus taurus TaxID=166361 RepID=UPI000C2034E4|nr:transcriptional regulator ATRX homolog [Onthophagus taurus]